MKLGHAVWGHPRWMGHGGEVWQNVVHWRREWQTIQYSCLENPMNSIKRQKDRTLKEELPRLVGAQYAPADQWRNNSRKNEEMEPKQKQHPVVDVTGDGSKVRCCKEQYCIGTWNVRSMNQGKLEVVKQETARVSINILGISELRWTWMGEFNSDDHYIYSCGQESLGRNRVAIIVNKRVWNAVLGCNIKNDRMNSVYFQGKSFNITVQFSSVDQSCPTLCDPMNRSMPGFPVHHQLPEFTQTHVHRVSNAIQPPHPRSSIYSTLLSKFLYLID